MPRDPSFIGPDVDLVLWRKTLLDAAQIVRRGWCRGALGEDGGPRCAVGAISEAAKYVAPLGHYQDVFHAAARALADHINPNHATHAHVNTITGWNDHLAKTVEGVASTMEHVARSNP